MKISDNILKHHLQNVYVITGQACGGKTTASRYLADKYDLILLDWDEQFASYQLLVDPHFQPAMSQRPEFPSWEEYFMRPPEEYSEWLNTTFREQTEMVIAHLLKLAGNAEGKKIIVDGFFDVQTLKKISDYSRVVFLLSSEEVVRRDYFNRECKRDMYECIMGLRNPEAALENVFQTMFYKVEEGEKEICESGFRWFKRNTLGTDPMDTIKQIEEHFGFSI
ncbi:ATP-binding protein [Paenibacillus sp. KQZ6P-2]|uniref:ATP-binding protein n=1 Tax=Paenibacillus mangrovi TaxID=2931978 RepID=A0A9X2B555_9BACL|nr:ATP-binding protein [Paenibacillus mangrovi]MCJ8012332.1 ATP-binding protein [Paenibacillus mangrovi]